MVYKCSICGYVYDEEKEGKPFSELTECPVCKQPPERFQEVETEKKTGIPSEAEKKPASINAEGRPIWKPMHMQPMYRMHECVGREGTIRCRTNAYIAGVVEDVGADIFARGVCLPSDNKMTAEEQDRIIEVIRACFE